MATVNISAQHSKDRRHYNGLTDEAVMEQLITDPGSPLLIIGVVRRTFAKIDDRQGGAVTPTINLDWVECPTIDEDKATIRKMLTRLLKDRTSQNAADTDFGPYVPPQGALLDEHGNLIDHDEEQDTTAGPWPGDKDHPNTLPTDQVFSDAEPEEVNAPEPDEVTKRRQRGGGR